MELACDSGAEPDSAGAGWAPPEVVRRRRVPARAYSWFNGSRGVFTQKTEGDVWGRRVGQ